MSEQDDVELSEATGFGASLERIVEGGLLRVFASKPIQQAIGRLITGVMNVPAAALEIPTAFLQRISQGIKSDTQARAAVTAALAQNTIALTKTDDELTSRALARWTSGIKAKQRNVEQVAFRTVELLGQEDVPADTAAPSEEFMGPFCDLAEDASSEQLADLMARILAGEIRKPGSISRQTLRVVAALDQNVVTEFVSVLPYLVDNSWFVLPQAERNIWRGKFWLLANVGLTNEAGIRTLRHDNALRGAMLMGAKGIVYTCQPSLTGSWMIDGANLTIAGQELRRVCPDIGEPKVADVAGILKGSSYISKVEIGDVVSTPDSWGIVNEVEFF